MKDDPKYDLSRRKVLGGLGAIGLASAGAGLGTTAYFNDEESFENNTLTAGELNLLVDYSVDYDQGIAGSGQESGTVDGDVLVADENGDEVQDGDAVDLVLDDVKPGDSGHGQFCFRIVDNPAYMWAQAELTANDENGQSEPEAAVDQTGGDPGAGQGELAHSVEADVYYCNDEGDRIGEDSIASGSLIEVLAAFEDGQLLDGNANYGAQAGEQDAYDGTENMAGEEAHVNPCVCVDWEVPTDVGNEIQTDSVEFEFRFYAEQARHNDGTTNPYAPSA